MCVFCVEVVLCCNTRLSRHNRANPLIRGFPGRERTTCCCSPPPHPPPRSRSPTWKDCEGPDRCAGRWWRAPRLLGEHPRSRWGAERMRSGWNWKCTWKSKVSFYFPPNWIDVKCMKVLVRNIIQIETAFHSVIHLQNKGHFPGGSCVFNSPFGSPQFLFSSLALQRLLSVICGNQKKIKIKNALTDL